MGGGLINLWKKWEIQVLVLLSFTLQLILLGLARIRRRKGSALMRILLWLAYLMADSTAIYTLGHLSLSARSSEKQLVTFWAPLLLLHLGGPDTITAYTYEDNQLWLRHLLNLVVQVMGAAYVLYQSVASSQRERALLTPSLLMFVTGLVKYGERTWALKRANMDSIRGSLDLWGDSDRRQPYDGRAASATGTAAAELDSEEVLLGAHFTFNACKSHFVDDLITSGAQLEAINNGIQRNGGKYMYELIEMQLSLMYDILYTKAAVIYTWYGICIRLISPASTLASFLLFQFQLNNSSSHGDGGYSYSRADVMVTYILLAGAVVLEITSLVRVLGSSWACALLHARRWDRIHGAVRCLRRLVRAARRRRWLDSVGQYNLLDFCTRDRTELRSRIAKKVGLEEWWDKLHYSSTVAISDSLRDILLEEIPRRQLGDMRDARGRWTLQQIQISNPSGSSSRLYDEINWSVNDTDFDESILIWHVATDVYLCCRPRPRQPEDRLAKIVKALSDYMLFLFVVQPHMLPGPVRNSRYDNNCDGLVTLWEQHSAGTDPELTPRENLARLLLCRKYRDRSDDDDEMMMEEGDNNDGDPHGLAYIDAAVIAGFLLSERSGIPPDVLGMIAGVWIEMLCYAARHCTEVSHAKQLSSGGELVTAMGMLVEYTDRYGRVHPRVEDGRPVSGTPTEDGEPGGAAAEVSLHLDR